MPTLGTGDQTIKLTVRFFTDKIPLPTAGETGDGVILQKHARAVGRVSTRANKTHGIASRGRSFNSLAELPVAIAAVLAASGITLH